MLNSPDSEFLDGSGRGTEQQNRLFVVLAYGDGIWRCREVRARDHDDAIDKYSAIFDYEVMGVGLLGGSGHRFHWVASNSLAGVSPVGAAGKG
jgi:hypothetical protein